MDTLYTLLGVGTKATPEELHTAYTQQRERYNPERVADMGEDMRRIAAQRTAELDHAYGILSDPQQRQEYDARMGLGSLTPPTALPSHRKSQTRWFALGGLVVGLVLVAIVWVWASNQKTTPIAPSVHRPAPDFTLLTPDGEEITLADYRGKVVLINFWGTWCGPCVHEIPELQAAYEQLSDEGFVVIGVNLFENEQTQAKTVEDIQAFMDTNKITYPIVLDTDGSITNAYRVFPIPTSFFVDPAGNIRYVLPRELTAAEIQQWVAELQQEPTAHHTTEK